MKYTVKEVTSFSEETWKNKSGIVNHRCVFKVNGNDNRLSTFIQKAYQVGQEIEGEIVTKEKDGKTYHNFNEGKTATPSNQQPGTFQVSNAELKNFLIFKVQPILEQVHEMMRDIAKHQGVDVRYITGNKIDIPRITPETNASGYDALLGPKEGEAIDSDDLPF